MDACCEKPGEWREDRTGEGRREEEGRGSGCALLLFTLYLPLLLMLLSFQISAFWFKIVQLKPKVEVLRASWTFLDGLHACFPALSMYMCVFVCMCVCSSDADTPDKASVTTTAVEGKGKVNGATATSVGNETGCFRCAI